MDNTVFLSSAVKNVLAGFGSIGSAAVAAHEKTGNASYFGASSSGSSGASSSAPVIVPKIIVDSRPVDNVSHIIGNLLTLVALYFAFTCKTASGGIDFLQVIIALCCAPFYVVYRLARPCR